MTEKVWKNVLTWMVGIGEAMWAAAAIMMLFAAGLVFNVVGDAMLFLIGVAVGMIAGSYRLYNKWMCDLYGFDW